MQTDIGSRYNAGHGHGFIMPGAYGSDLYDEYSATEAPAAAVPEDPRKVTFSIGQGPKGSQTANIRML